MTRQQPCRSCGHSLPLERDTCPLCAGEWESWELRFPALPLEHVGERLKDWAISLPDPTIFEIEAAVEGLRIRLFTAPGMAEGPAAAWASLTRQHSRWVPCDTRLPAAEPMLALSPSNLLPVLAAMEGDPFLAVGGGLKTLSKQHGRPVRLFFAVLGAEDRLQERLRALHAYAVGTEKGVEDDTPNPWSLRLGLWRGVIGLGGLIAAAGGAALAPGWLPMPHALLAVFSGALLGLSGFLGMLGWLRFRSLPHEIVAPRLQGPLLRVSAALAVPDEGSFRLLSGEQRWVPVKTLWPGLEKYGFPLPAADFVRLIAPLENSEGTGMLARGSIDDIPGPSPSEALKQAPFLLGVSVATGDPVGIDLSGHALVVGGSRTGKSSAVFGLMRQLTADPEGAPGLFLADPHGSLSDSFLHHVDNLPDDLRTAAIDRLRIITPHPEFIVPLNLLTVADFTWAGNALILAGQRIWGDFWGPRMQAAFLALCRLAHAWNRHHPEAPMGLLHTVFAAYDTDWRKKAAEYLPPEHRMGAAALDALFGQSAGGVGPARPGWVTEVVSPIISKMMSLELSPWLFSSMHQAGFVDLESWVRERAWVVLRLPSGEMGREGAQLSAGMLYNLFEAAFRRTTARSAVPFHFVIDEVQEIGAAMALEGLLSEGGKFGARVSVLAQSLSMLRKVEGFEPVVQSLLANTSTQLFFSPDPDDADLMRRTLSLAERYGPTTIDIPSLQAWLRARVDGHWQPPARIRVEPLPRPDPEGLARLIEAVFRAHPEAYIPMDQSRIEASHFQGPGSGYLMRAPGESHRQGTPHVERRTSPDPRKLGWE